VLNKADFIEYCDEGGNSKIWNGIGQ